MHKKEEDWMRAAMELAQRCAASGDVPIGAVVVDAQGSIVGRGWNQREAAGHDPSAHAEIVALRDAAGRAGSWNLSGHTLVVTLEPCVMCAGAIGQARLDRVIFGAWDEKAGAAGSVWDLLRDPRALHWVEVVGGVLEENSAQMLREFFVSKRADR